mmetsp:Transcript_3398/g.10562  ORF Transcript_3398/g.10562 Transcript_3398/m.10562 type:complete len:83 (+) Transcript_3398:892-1140(+)
MRILIHPPPTVGGGTSFLFASVFTSYLLIQRADGSHELGHNQELSFTRDLIAPQGKPAFLFVLINQLIEGQLHVADHFIMKN